MSSFKTSLGLRGFHRSSQRSRRSRNYWGRKQPRRLAPPFAVSSIGIRSKHVIAYQMEARSDGNRTIKEIRRKASRIAPAYNKGALQYLPDD